MYISCFIDACIKTPRSPQLFPWCCGARKQEQMRRSQLLSPQLVMGGDYHPFLQTVPRWGRLGCMLNSYVSGAAYLELSRGMAVCIIVGMVGRIHMFAPSCETWVVCTSQACMVYPTLFNVT